MIFVILAGLFFALCGIFCIRHFAAQIIAFKVLLDSLACLFILFRSEKPSAAAGLESFAWILASLGMCSLFLMLAVAAKRFAGSPDLKVEDGPS